MTDFYNNSFCLKVEDVIVVEDLSRWQKLVDKHDNLVWKLERSRVSKCHFWCLTYHRIASHTGKMCLWKWFKIYLHCKVTIIQSYFLPVGVQ